MDPALGQAVDDPAHGSGRRAAARSREPGQAPHVAPVVLDGVGTVPGFEREVIRDSTGVICSLPGGKMVLDKSSPEMSLTARAFERTGELSRYYRFKFDHEDRTAGRASRNILVMPIDGFRYGYRIWIDEETGLLLRSDLVMENGEAIEQMMFTSINVMQQASPSMLEAVTVKHIHTTQSATKAASIQSSAPQIAGLEWRVERLPVGFQLIDRYQHQPGAERALLEHMVFSDGLASVSVFIDKRTDTPPFEGLSSMGAVNAFGKMLSDNQIVVVGAVPASSVKMIGESVSYR